MPFDFRNEVKDEKNTKHKRILAICDECGVQKTVRRSWAVSKIRKDGISEYYCAECSGKKNIEKAMEAKMYKLLLNEFIYLCEGIFVNLLDDKSELYISQQLNNDSIGLIRDARKFVQQYMYTGLSDEIIQCAEYIEQGASKEIVDLYTWDVQMKARTMLYLEQLPRPDGI